MFKIRLSGTGKMLNRNRLEAPSYFIAVGRFRIHSAPRSVNVLALSTRTVYRVPLALNAAPAASGRAKP